MSRGNRWGQVFCFNTFDGRKFGAVDDDEFFYRNTKLATLCAQNRSLNMRGITNLEEAIRWITSETPLTPPDGPMRSRPKEPTDPC
jgi:hypothetical protein